MPSAILHALLQRQRAVGGCGAGNATLWSMMHSVVPSRADRRSTASRFWISVVAQPRGRLVQQQQFRLAHHRHGDAQHLLLPIGQLGGKLIAQRIQTAQRQYTIEPFIDIGMAPRAAPRQQFGDAPGAQSVTQHQVARDRDVLAHRQFQRTAADSGRS